MRSKFGYKVKAGCEYKCWGWVTLHSFGKSLLNSAEHYSFQTAARKITFLLDDTQQSEKVEQEDGGLQVAMEVEHLGNMVAEQLNHTKPMALEYPNISK